jgi:hypothetical protein
MSITLVKEDGTGLANANAYASASTVKVESQIENPARSASIYFGQP